MSYCVDKNNYLPDPGNGDFNAWISVLNWEAFGSGFPNGLIPDLSTVFSMGPAQSGESTLRIAAMVDETGIANILRVESGDGLGVSRDVTDSPYHVTVKDSSGAIVSRTKVDAVRTHVDSIDGPIPLSFISAEVPSTGAASLEITANDVIIASRVRSANIPRVTLLSPKAGDRVPGTRDTIVAWEAIDADGDPLEARVEYSTDDGKTFRVIASGVIGSQVSLPSRLFSFSDKARIRVKVNDGFNDGVALSGRFQALGSSPEVRITDPPSDTRIPQDVNLHLVGEAYDDAGTQLTENSLRWYDGKKLIGNGQNLDVSGFSLSLGLHIVQLAAMDARGNSARKSVSVEVLPPQNTPGLAPTANFRITNVAPRVGLPGTKLTITGRGFAGATAITFYGTPATFTVMSNSVIRATVPVGATTGLVCVTGPAGTTCSSFNFTFPGPVITKFAPKHGPTGTTVTIYGRYFSGATDVKFNGTPATFTVMSNLQIKATVPLGATTGPISVTTPYGTAALLLKPFPVRGHRE